VHGGCSQFSRCCYLIIDLGSRLSMEAGPGLSRSHLISAVELGCDWPELFYSRSRCVLVRWRPGRKMSVCPSDSRVSCSSMFRWVLARSCFSVMEICLAESGTCASSSMLLGRWATVIAQPKKAVSQISLAFEEHGWQDLQRSPLEKQLGKLQHQLSGVRAAAKALGHSAEREVNSVKKRVICAAARDQDWKSCQEEVGEVARADEESSRIDRKPVQSSTSTTRTRFKWGVPTSLEQLKSLPNTKAPSSNRWADLPERRSWTVNWSAWTTAGDPTLREESTSSRSCRLEKVPTRPNIICSKVLPGAWRNTRSKGLMDSPLHQD
jgi:hypothetical protein